MKMMMKWFMAVLVAVAGGVTHSAPNVPTIASRTASIVVTPFITKSPTFSSGFSFSTTGFAIGLATIANPQRRPTESKAPAGCVAASGGTLPRVPPRPPPLP